MRTSANGRRIRIFDLSSINGLSLHWRRRKFGATLRRASAAVIARERQMPAALRAARRNVRNPPPDLY